MPYEARRHHLRAMVGLGAHIFENDLVLRASVSSEHRHEATPVAIAKCYLHSSQGEKTRRYERHHTRIRWPQVLQAQLPTERNSLVAALLRSLWQLQPRSCAF